MLEEFIINNIEKINGKLSYVDDYGYNKNTVKEFLGNKFRNDVKEKHVEMINRFEEEKFVKKSIEMIANEYKVYKNDLSKFYEKVL